MVSWYTKGQKKVESSLFGSKFTAMKNAIEALRALRYKLQMMGVPVSMPSFVIGDNISVIMNSSVPESTLCKKNHAIMYHTIYESVAMGESTITYVPTDNNLSDILTKVLPGSQH